MKKFSKNKIALFLACTSILGGKTQAMNTPKSRQSLAAVGGATDKKSNKGFVNWVKNHKLGVGVGGALTAAAAITLTVLGVKYWGKKESGKPDKSKLILDKIKNEQKENSLEQSGERNKKLEDSAQKRDETLLEQNNGQDKKFENQEQKQSGEEIEDNKIEDNKKDAPVEIIDKNVAKLKEYYGAPNEEKIEKFVQKLKDIRGKLTFEILTSAEVFTKDDRDDDESWFDYKIVDNPETYNKLIAANCKLVSKDSIKNNIVKAVEETIEKLFSKEFPNWELPTLLESKEANIWVIDLGNRIYIYKDEEKIALQHDNQKFYFDISKLR